METQTNTTIALWCGWRDITPEGGPTMWEGRDGKLSQRYPKYNDLNACAEFEARAEERGLGLTYAYQLMMILRGHDLRPSRNSIDWSTLKPEAITRLVVKATPEQRCEAILQVIDEAEATA